MLIAGAGQLGSRYLQGLAKCSNLLRVYVVDPSPESRRLAAKRWQEVGGGASHHVVSYHDDLEEVATNLDLAIVATTASVRPTVVEGIASHAGVGQWILEKVLARSEGDLNRIVDAISEPASAWVNTWARMTPWYRQIRSQLDDSSVRFGITGGSWGLACNAIHVLDLMAWWTGEDLVGVDAAGLDPEWLPSRRPDNLEVSGILAATYSGGSYGLLSATRPLALNEPAGGSMPDVLWIESPSLRWDIDQPFNELGSCASASDGREVHGRIEYQTERTAPLVDSLLNTGLCDLTDLTTSVSQHRILLRGLLERWREVDGSNADRVPIT